jgi:uncharacterized Fe-S radical SAM superfamily protein PflX
MVRCRDEVCEMVAVERGARLTRNGGGDEMWLGEKIQEIQEIRQIHEMQEIHEIRQIHEMKEIHEMRKTRDAKDTGDVRDSRDARDRGEAGDVCETRCGAGRRRRDGGCLQGRVFVWVGGWTRDGLEARQGC